MPYVHAQRGMLTVGAPYNHEKAPFYGACLCSPLPVGDRPATDVSRLVHLYVCDGLSTYRIAGLTGLDRQKVTRILRRERVALRPRGAGGTRPERRAGDPPDLATVLAELYTGMGLTIAQVSALLSIPARTVHDRLRRYGIPVRSRGGWNREDRRTLPVGHLRDLYSRDGLSAQDVSRKLDTSRTAVLRGAHDYGLPVRTGGFAPVPGPAEIELINALYSDPVVSMVLAKHRIPRVPAGGPVWQRFPTRVPLSKQLVEDLYWRCGVATSHIELLTGQPAQTVAGFMRREGIALRHPGCRSPFLRRWVFSAAAAASACAPA